MDISKVVKDINRLNLAMKKLVSPKTVSDFEKVEQLKKALQEVRNVSIEELSSYLEQTLQQTQEVINRSLEERRETLLLSAREENLQCKRFGDYDRVDIFKVSYKGKKVRLEVGSESVCDFEESDGAKVLARIQEERRKLEESPFSRERFFQILQYAWLVAQREKKDTDGWAPVRLLHAYVAMLRNLDSDKFLKDPSPKKAQPYSTAQFVFDLARFGRHGWTCGEYVLRSQTPNMNTVAAKKALTLPDLEAVDRLGPQLAVLKIKKAEG
ncbi:MAG: hypothetical protein ACPL7J_05690 [Desulfomonilaceae bacterium]